MYAWTKCNHERSMDTAQSTEDKREKIQALSLAKECYSMKLDLLTNATVVDDGIRFVSQKSKELEELIYLDPCFEFIDQRTFFFNAYSGKKSESEVMAE
jgi:hypothetical protein